ncbi:PIN domain-containing protein [Acidomonas methanolica]|uniref:hypothetical protein n=1 Tax=Acidomonas methanolica TaxID=437 RepID=UPI00211A4B41|nr:hypothetical protein [Acidomonas methanolica]MCQ9157045.1 hypothetical protein [Acidomonas methanolica]
MLVYTGRNASPPLSASCATADLQAARELGRMTQAVCQAGRMPEMADLAIAATAMVKGYVVLTRNLRHFQGTGVTAFDPFESPPTQGWQAALSYR